MAKIIRRQTYLRKLIKKINDSFRKVAIVGEDIAAYMDENR